MDTLSTEDLEVIRDILTSYKDSGIENPLLPTDIDVDGDGIADAFGLDENGDVILVSGVLLEETVYVADGEEE